MYKVFLLLFLMLGGASYDILYAQSLLEKEVVLERDVGTIKDFLDDISQLAKINFSYSSIPFSDTVQVPVAKYTVRYILGYLFKGKEITYQEHQDHIILKKLVTNGPVVFSGKVIQKETGEVVPGAYIQVPGLGLRTVTNNEGLFTLKVPLGKHAFHISHVSFQSKIEVLDVTTQSSGDFILIETAVSLSNVVINAIRPAQEIESLDIGRNTLGINAIKSMPALFGEVDILRSLQFLPGIHTGGDWNTGLFVRGGSTDQNLIQINGATLYNPNHFGGLFSIFNPDIVREVEIYKGSIPVRMGGRLSSVFNNLLKTGDKQNFKGSGGIGLISSRLLLEGPIIKDKASFVVSARRTYLDMLLKLSTDPYVKTIDLFFYDLNANIDFAVNPKNRLTLSLYKGNDVFRLGKFIGLEWGNRIASLNWSHTSNEKLFVNTNVSWTDYGYDFLVDVEDEVHYVWKSKVKELNAKVDVDLRLTDKSTLNLGYQAILHDFSPVFLKAVDNAASSGTVKLDHKHALEQALYFGNEYTFSPKFSISYGLRYSLFQNIGPGKVLLYKDENDKSLSDVKDTLTFKKYEIMNTYHGPEPRLMARYSLSKTSSLKGGYSRMRQYIQVVSNATAGQPTDRWVPADKYIRPQAADQISIGYFKNFSDDQFEASVELYYRHMKNQLDVKEDIVLMNNIQNQDGGIQFNNYLETQLLSGKAWAYGSEFFLKKSKGMLNGMASYTWSKARRQIEGINLGKPYSPRYDLTHAVSITLNYEPSKKFSFGASWIYNTGDAVTFPRGKYTFEGKEVPYYAPGKRNQDRLPDYHRLDLSVTFTPKPHKVRRWHGSWNVSLFNAYSRKNPISLEFTEVMNNDILFDPSGGEPIKTRELKPVKTYFSPIPSISYNFNF